MFRDLINIHRRAYLKARKNDKPAISRNIVRQIRAKGGRFLKKDEKSGLWFEVGDDAARYVTISVAADVLWRMERSAIVDRQLTM